MIKKSRRFIRIAALAALFFAAGAMHLDAQKYDSVVDKSVAVIGNDIIMLSQIESEAQMMRMRGLQTDQKIRCDILEQMLIAKLFYVQAQMDSIVVSDANVDAAVESRIDEVYSALGGEKQVEEYFKMPIHKLKQEWREMMREQSLIQEKQRQVASEVPKLTPSDIQFYCDTVSEEDKPVVPTKYRFRQIAVYPDREAANLAVKEKLIGLRERIVGGEKFATLARLYSQDPGSMGKGGELGMMSKNVFWPQFSDAAMSLKVGQVSQVVETPDGFHIIQMIEKDGDMFNARHILIKPAYGVEDRARAFDRLDSIRTLITGGEKEFADAAKTLSQDPKTATSGGLMADENTGSSYFEKDQLKPMDYAVLKDMKEGDISEPFESLDNEGRSGNTVYKIIYLEKVIPSHTASFSEDYSDLLDEVTRQQASAAIDRFIKAKQKTTHVRIDPMFQGCAFQYDGWIK